MTTYLNASICVEYFERERERERDEEKLFVRESKRNPLHVIEMGRVQDFSGRTIGEREESKKKEEREREREGRILHMWMRWVDV